jgi:folate-binding protein YgfZ
MSVTMPDTAFYTTLRNRGKITISGADARVFLQGLITNDITLLDTQASVYACLLTPQGKFTHDFFVTEKDGAVILECEGGDRTDDLLRRLSIYKLRAAVELQAENAVPVYALFNTDQYGAPDPRHTEMGYRSFEKPEDMDEQPFDVWDALRISLTLPDGSRDLIPEKSTLDEGRIDQINGVSYDKGCYVGQELTARMHYRGLGKKHLQTVEVNDLPDKAELRSFCGEHGLALVRTAAN